MRTPASQHLRKAFAVVASGSRRAGIGCAVSLLCAVPALSQGAPGVDSDGDGLSDALEAALLQQFRPALKISADDCSAIPARFMPGVAIPRVLADDGTIYGQASPRPRAASAPAQIELHFYHLWRRDCGRMGHTLDAEHVAVLLEPDPLAGHADAWRAVYWYAAAHEDTVCDASQMTRASTVEATTHGATVWISSGKHASFLDEELCRHGCGGDRCPQSISLPASAVVNVGEPQRPMNAAAWVASSQWPLLVKMRRSDFTADRLARLERLPATDIAWANPAKRPAQAAILGGNTTLSGTLKGSEATGDALATTGHSTDTALIVSASKTSGALGTAARKTGHALSRAAHRVGHALGGPKEKSPAPQLPQ